MPEPLKWDTTGLKWDSNLTWDGQQAAKTKSKTMSTKAIINFSRYSQSALGPASQHIHDQMSANSAVFTTPPITMVNLQTLITANNTTLVAKESGTPEDAIAFEEARQELLDALSPLGNYVNTVADGDPMIVAQSGFPSYDTDHPANDDPPAAPLDLTLKHGTVSGTVVARYKPERDRSTNVIEMNTVNPMIEAEWHQKGIFTGGKATLTGLTPGTQIWIRVATVGNNGVMGAWSDPAHLWVV